MVNYLYRFYASFVTALLDYRKSVGENLFQSLNEALYQAKASGGNQVWVVENDPLSHSE